MERVSGSQAELDISWISIKLVLTDYILTYHPYTFKDVLSRRWGEEYKSIWLRQACVLLACQNEWAFAGPEKIVAERVSLR
jgi:hypothetical protein